MAGFPNNGTGLLRRNRRSAYEAYCSTEGCGVARRRWRWLPVGAAGGRGAEPARRAAQRVAVAERRDGDRAPCGGATIRRCPMRRSSCATSAPGRSCGSTRANELGRFTFPKVSAGSYVVELVDENRNVLALGEMFTIGPTETVATFIRLGRLDAVVRRVLHECGGGGDRGGSRGRRDGARQRRPAGQRAVLRGRRCPALDNSALPRRRT